MELQRMHAFRRTAVAALIAAATLIAPSVFAQSSSAKSSDPCSSNAKACIDLALDAMGGRDRLAAVKNITYESQGYTELTEQSYRQAPFITAYTHTKGTIDFERQRLLLEIQMTWPESDPGQFQSTATVVAGPDGAIRRGKSDSPASIATVDSARYALALGPMRLLLSASADSSLRIAKPEMIRGTLHPAVEFTYEGRQ